MIGVNVALAKNGDIQFFTEGSSGYFYDVSTLMQESGIDYWLIHLGRKSWFTSLVRQAFIEVWHSAKGAN